VYCINNLVGLGVSYGGVSFQGDAQAIGFFTGASGNLGFGSGIIMATGAVAAFLWSMKRGGWNFGERIDFNSALYIKSTAATYAVLSMTQMANLLQARSEKLSVFVIGFFGNKYLIGAIFVSVAMLLSFLYIPFFQSYLHMAPIDRLDWLVVVGATLAVFLVEEARKAEARK
jgi:magnesium-transporting ATPase (P-type)